MFTDAIMSTVVLSYVYLTLQMFVSVIQSTIVNQAILQLDDRKWSVFSLSLETAETGLTHTPEQERPNEA